MCVSNSMCVAVFFNTSGSYTALLMPYFHARTSMLTCAWICLSSE